MLFNSLSPAVLLALMTSATMGQLLSSGSGAYFYAMQKVSSGAQVPRTVTTDCRKAQAIYRSLGISVTTCAIPGVYYDSLGRVTDLIIFTNTSIFAGPRIPTTIANLTSLKSIFFDARNGGGFLSGPIPSEIGTLSQLEYLYLVGHKLTGPIPASIGNMPKLLFLGLGRNQLTGVPDSLVSSPVRNQELFPNPMTNVPYDLVIPTPLSNLTKANMIDFFSRSPVLSIRKRQLIPTQYTLQQLIDMCPLSNITNTDEDIKTGCLVGIREFCKDKYDLTECYNYYDSVFARSIYKDLRIACPAWKLGNDSAECGLSLNRFPVGSSYRTAAEFFRESIFGSPNYAPCYPNRQNCKWRKGVKVALPEGREIIVS